MAKSKKDIKVSWKYQTTSRGIKDEIIDMLKANKSYEDIYLQYGDRIDQKTLANIGVFCLLNNNHKLIRKMADKKFIFMFNNLYDIDIIDLKCDNKKEYAETLKSLDVIKKTPHLIKSGIKANNPDIFFEITKYNFNIVRVEEFLSDNIEKNKFYIKKAGCSFGVPPGLRASTVINLLDLGADPDKVYGIHKLIHHYFSNKEIISELKKRNYDITTKDINGYNILDLCFYHGVDHNYITWLIDEMNIKPNKYTYQKITKYEAYHK